MKFLYLCKLEITINNKTYFTMKKAITLLLLACLTFALQAQAPVSYQFQKLTEPYQDLTGATSLNEGLQWDDPEYLVSLGMNFDIFGLTFNELYFNLMGCGFTNMSEEFFDKSTLYLMLTPLYSDMIDRCYGEGDDTSDVAHNGKIGKGIRYDGDPGSCSNLSYKIEGSAGNRIFKMEWNNVSMYGVYDSCFLNMQVWFYENGNIIEFRYGPSYISSDDWYDQTSEMEGMQPLFALVDLDYETGNAAGLYGDPDNPTFECLALTDTTSTELLYSGLSSLPAANTVYRFTPHTTGIAGHTVSDISIRPNPVRDRLTLSGVETADIQIFDIAGHLVMSGTYSGSMDVSGLPNGAYFVNISTPDGQAVKKMVKF